MVKYKEKVCLLCGEVYSPTNPKQKYCVNCKVEGKKLWGKACGKERDRIRNRKRYNYTEYTRNCKHCGIEFKTYYKKKVYCGADECDKVRLCIKSKRIRAKQPREYMLAKSRLRYKENREELLIKSAIKYREHNPDAKPYVGGKIHKWTLEDVREYVESRGYKLLSDKYVNNRQKLLLECPKGHEWETTLHGFKDGETNCFWCYLDKYISKFKTSVKEYVHKVYPGPIIYNDCKQRVDNETGSFLELYIWFPDLNKAIECNGLYWYERKKAEVRNKIKQQLCKRQGIDLLVITDDDWPSEIDKININNFVEVKNENLLG
jgi:hypothetical protein